MGAGEKSGSQKEIDASPRSAPEFLHFLLTGTIEGFSFNPERKAGLLFASSDPPLNVSIKPQQPDEDGFGYRLGVKTRLEFTFPCTALQRMFVEGFIERRISPYGPAPMQLPFINKGKVVVDAEGNLAEGASFWFEWLPEDLRKCLDEVATKSSLDITRFFKLLRWQQDELLAVPSHSDLTLYWRTADSGLYHYVPRKGSTNSGLAAGGFHWDDEDETEFSGLWGQAELQEPLAHELLQEAQQIISTAPRSALLICASALEIGVKAHIARIAPITDWLVFNMPAPPTYKILRGYLPIIHADRSTIDWSKLKPLFNQCQQLAEARNKLAHVGSTPPSDEIDNFMCVASDVLYFLDFLEGHDWVKEHVTPTTRTALAWPKPRRQQFHFTMRAGPDVG